MTRHERVILIIGATAAVADGLAHEAPVRQAASEVMHVAVISLSASALLVLVTVATWAIARRARRQRATVPRRIVTPRPVEAPARPAVPRRKPGRLLAPGALSAPAGDLSEHYRMQGERLR